jgi:predicted TIM-barrel fold metal-dependent hydrolase
MAAWLNAWSADFAATVPGALHCATFHSEPDADAYVAAALEEGAELFNVHLDTTMAFTDFVERFAPYPRALVPRLAAHADRIVLGSDFPNIPYHYAHQIETLARLGLGADWLRAVCWHNPSRLLAAVGA